MLEPWEGWRLCKPHILGSVHWGSGASPPTSNIWSLAAWLRQLSQPKPSPNLGKGSISDLCCTQDKQQLYYGMLNSLLPCRNKTCGEGYGVKHRSEDWDLRMWDRLESVCHLATLRAPKSLLSSGSCFSLCSIYSLDYDLSGCYLNLCTCSLTCQAMVVWVFVGKDGPAARTDVEPSGLVE